MGNYIQLNCKNCFNQLLIQNISNCPIQNIAKGGINRVLFLSCDQSCETGDWNSQIIWNSLINQCKIKMSPKILGSKTTDNITAETSFCNDQEVINQKHTITIKQYYDLKYKEAIHLFYYNIYKNQKNYKFGYLTCDNNYDFQGWHNFRMQFNWNVDESAIDGYQYFEIIITYYKNGLLPATSLINISPDIFNNLLTQNCSNNTNCNSNYCWTNTENNTRYISFSLTYPNITLPTEAEIDSGQKIEYGIGFACENGNQNVGLFHAAIRQKDGFYPDVPSLLNAFASSFVGPYTSNAVVSGNTISFTIEEANMLYYLNCDFCTHPELLKPLTGVQDIITGNYLPMPGYNGLTLDFTSFTFNNNDNFCITPTELTCNIGFVSNCFTYISSIYPTPTDFVTAFMQNFTLANPGIIYQQFGTAVALYVPYSYFTPIPDCDCPNLISKGLAITKNLTEEIFTSYYNCPTNTLKVNYLTPISGPCGQADSPLPPLI